jgi:hypothetical protein
MKAMHPERRGCCLLRCRCECKSSRCGVYFDELTRESPDWRTPCWSGVISSSQFHFCRYTDGRADGAI